MLIVFLGSLADLVEVERDADESPTSARKLPSPLPHIHKTKLDT